MVLAARDRIRRALLRVSTKHACIACGKIGVVSCLKSVSFLLGFKGVLVSFFSFFFWLRSDRVFGDDCFFVTVVRIGR